MCPGDPDVWESVRETQRAQVQAAFAPRPRRCPHCDHVQTIAGRRCERCGEDMVARRGRLRRGRAALIAGAVLAVVAAVCVAVIPGMLASARDEERAAADRQSRLEAAERVRLRADVRPLTAAAPPRRRGEGALDYRRRLVQRGEAAITADARRRVAAGTVDGPIFGTSCSPYPKTEGRQALEADPAIARGRYQCIAYETEIELSELQGRARTGLYGTPYWLIVTYSGEPLTFCKITPRPGEGGKPLAAVEVPSACRDPLRQGG